MNYRVRKFWPTQPRLNYAFRRFFEEEIDYAIAKIMGGMPEYRKTLTEAMELEEPPQEIDEDWSEDMITWRSR